MPDQGQSFYCSPRPLTGVLHPTIFEGLQAARRTLIFV
jgi:hypothetical protein